MRAAFSAAALCAALCACTRAGVQQLHLPGELRMDLATDPSGFNPLVVDDGNTVALCELVCGFLLRANDKGRLIPDLAIEVPTRANGGISRDGLEIRYKLRRGATWHDGRPFDSHDVVFSFKAAMNPNVNVPDRSGFEDVTSVEAPGPYDVRVRMKRPYSAAVATFFTLAANDPYPILPAHLLANVADLNKASYNGAPVGLGPFKFVEWRRGDRIILAADHNYFRGRPGLEKISLRILPDQNSDIGLWKTYQLDLLGLTGDTDQLRQIRGSPHTRVRLYPTNNTEFMLFQHERPITRDRRVRAAIVAGIDRARFMRQLRGEFYQPAEGDRLPGQFAYDPSIRQPPYDPKRAAAVLDAAGWLLRGKVREKAGVPLRLILISGVTPLARRAPILLQQQLAQLGINATIKPYDYKMLVAPASAGGILAKGAFDLYKWGWLPGGVHDLSYLYRCESRPPEGENYSRICDPVIDANARLELMTTDPVIEARADQAILRRLIERSDVLFFGFSKGGVALREGLEGYRPSALVRSFWNPWAWHWSR